MSRKAKLAELEERVRVLCAQVMDAQDPTLFRGLLGQLAKAIDLLRDAKEENPERGKEAAG